MTEKRTEISSLGEFGLIDRISKRFESSNSGTIKGIDDDAAVIRMGPGYSLLSTDMLLEGIHFDLSYFPLKHLGYKAVVVNVSDIAAMNGTPRQLTVNLGLSNRFSVEAVDELYDGIYQACQNYQLDLVGGDTTSSNSGLVISVSITGEVAEKQICYRSGAKQNDILCVSGDLGAAYVGLQVLEREKQVFLTDPEMQPRLERYSYIVERQLKPEARMDIIKDLDRLKVVPNAMIDLSDGLASDLIHMCHQSKLGAKLYENKIPIDNRAMDTLLEFGIEPFAGAMNGGEDYELLFAIGQDDYTKIEGHPDISAVGHLSAADEGLKLVSESGAETGIQAQGWKHF